MLFCLSVCLLYAHDWQRHWFLMELELKAVMSYLPWVLGPILSWTVMTLMSLSSSLYALSAGITGEGEHAQRLKENSAISILGNHSTTWAMSPAPELWLFKFSNGFFSWYSILIEQLPEKSRISWEWPAQPGEPYQCLGTTCKNPQMCSHHICEELGTGPSDAEQI